MKATLIAMGAALAVALSSGMALGDSQNVSFDGDWTLIEPYSRSHFDIQQIGGRGVVSSASEDVVRGGGGFRSRYGLMGDFDVTVDWGASVFPQPTDPGNSKNSVELMVSIPGTPNHRIVRFKVGDEHVNPVDDGFSVWNEDIGGHDFVSNPALSGTMRLVRSGTTLSAFGNGQLLWAGEVTTADATVQAFTTRFDSSTPTEFWFDNLAMSAESFTRTGSQACYLDFSGYTAPAGYGTAEQIAADVKASVASKFTQDNLSFYTSFDSVTPDPAVTSTITFGGTHATPTLLGYAPYDPGNADRSDTGYVYTDQPLFTSMPTNSTEYKNMLANATAHETGHLLGYSHADAAGMPFLLSGDAMEARILQDMQLGELGQVTQMRYTYVADTDYDPTAPLPPIVYMPKTSATPEQQQQMMQEMEDFYRDAGGDGLADLERAWCTVADVEGVVETALTGSWKPDPIFDGGCLVLQLNNHPEYVEFFFGAIVFGDKPDELNLESNLTFIQPQWDESLGGYIFRFDGLTEEEILNSDISLTFMAPGDDINDFTLRFLESDLTDVGGASFVVQNVPEPTALAMMAVSGLALLRRRRAA